MCIYERSLKHQVSTTNSDTEHYYEQESDSTDIVPTTVYINHNKEPLYLYFFLGLMRPFLCQVTIWEQNKVTFHMAEGLKLLPQ